MIIYGAETKARIRELRRNGRTYTEIQTELGQQIPKGSLAYICKGIILKTKDRARIQQLIRSNADAARKIAVTANRQKLETKIKGYADANQNLIPYLQDRRGKLIALAMLYLGEGTKWQKSRAPKLASSSPQIISLYIKLLAECYGIQTTQLRCRVQHRADQNSENLVDYWSNVTGVSRQKFYPCYIDKRTIGQITKKPNYHGVCTVACAGTYIQLELKEIADIISTAVVHPRGIGAVG